MRVNVDLGERGYDVVIESGARHQLNDLIAQRAPRAQFVAIVAPTSLQAQPWFDFALEMGYGVVTVPEGERAKSLSVIEFLCGEFSSLGLSRHDVVVGVGGGATTDVAGFAAATYLRGVAVAHVATSVVAQVDAAIGGKTGVNLASGKNLVGAFHQPIGVLCDLETLATLPAREHLCGLGEVAKCWLLESRNAADLENADDFEWLATAVQLKAAIVAADEREGGLRALLNYGHTLAHALEALQLSGEPLDLLHGEAVAIGVAFAARLAERLGRVGADVVAEHDAVLDFFGLPSRLPSGVDLEAVIAAMYRDKKAHHDLTFVLAGHGGFETVPAVSNVDVRAALAEFEGER